MRLRSRAYFGLFLVGLVAAGCTGDSGAAVLVTRDTLANGAERLRYAALPAPAEGIAPDLTIGKMDGEAHEIFGDVRGIEADADGNIYVLDYQAGEIRAYDAAGVYLRTLTRKGQGPGELSAANGMILTHGDTLWVQDHGQMQNIALDLEGNELARFAMHVRNYGYVWNGTVDERGRFWKPTSHSDADRVFPPPEGLTEGTSRQYFVWLDRTTGQTDSVFVGENAFRTHISRNNRGGHSYRGIPFAASRMVIVDPADGFWVTSAETYRIARLDADGDTALVIEADVPPIPVTDEDRRSFVTAEVERNPESRRTAEELAGLMPAARPVIEEISIDDEGRLWVKRVTRANEAPLFDVFARDGRLIGSVQLDFTPQSYIPKKIRRGKLYALVRDSLDVPTVVRAPLPALTH